MHSIIYPADPKRYFLQQLNKTLLLTIKLLNSNLSSDVFYEDKLQTSNQKKFSIKMVLKKSNSVN